MAEKVTVIAPVRNEEKNIGYVVESLLNQSREPDEVIIVDGGSTDKTKEILKEYEKQHKKVKTIFKECKNVSVARNAAIEKATGEIIACTDGGCKTDPNWLKNLLKNFPEADISAGIARPQENTPFKKVLGAILFAKRKQSYEDSPSSRSIAFKKSAWKAVGGYPEDLYTGEDTIFNVNLKKSGFKIKPAQDAIVYWNMRDNLFLLMRQYRRYGVGDGESRLPFKVFRGEINSHILNSLIITFGGYGYILLLFLSLVFSFYFGTTILLGILLVYLLSGIPRALIKSKSIKAIYYAPAIHITRRLGYFIGINSGFFGKKITKQ